MTDESGASSQQDAYRLLSQWDLLDTTEPVVFISGCIGGPRRFDARWMSSRHVKGIGKVEPYLQKGSIKCDHTWTPLRVLNPVPLPNFEAGALELESRFPGIKTWVVYPPKPIGREKTFWNRAATFAASLMG